MVSHATGMTTKAGRAIRMSENGKPFAMTAGGNCNYMAKAYKKNGNRVHAGMNIPGRAMPKDIMRRKISLGVRRSL